MEAAGGIGIAITTGVGLILTAPTAGGSDAGAAAADAAEVSLLLAPTVRELINTVTAMTISLLSGDVIGALTIAMSAIPAITLIEVETEVEEDLEPIIEGEIAATEGAAGAEPGRTSTPEVGSKISQQKQARHILGDRLYGGGGYFTNAGDAQRVLDAYRSGDATVLGTSRTGNIIVRYNAVTGYNNNPTAGYLDQETNIFMIKGTNSPSIVPINPNWSGG